MTENYGIEGWNSPSIFFFLVPDKQWGLLGEEVLFSVLYILILGAVSYTHLTLPTNSRV